jgi:hypothetical protein
VSACYHGSSHTFASMSIVSRSQTAKFVVAGRQVHQFLELRTCDGFPLPVVYSHPVVIRSQTLTAPRSTLYAPWDCTEPHLCAWSEWLSELGPHSAPDPARPHTPCQNGNHASQQPVHGPPDGACPRGTALVGQQPGVWITRPEPRRQFCVFISAWPCNRSDYVLLQVGANRCEFAGLRLAGSSPSPLKMQAIRSTQRSVRLRCWAGSAVVGMTQVTRPDPCNVAH